MYLELVVVITPATVTASTLVCFWKTEHFWMLISTRHSGMESSMLFFIRSADSDAGNDVTCIVEVAPDAVDSTASLACCCPLHSIVM